MTNPVQINVSRNVVEVGTTRTRALMALAAERGRPGIISVGETADELRSRLATLKERGELGAIPAIVVPGDDPWWDAAWQHTARDFRGVARRSVPEDVAPILVIEPLRRATWSPILLRALVAYAFGVHSRGTPSSWRARPKYRLSVTGDFDGAEYAAIVDAARQPAGLLLRLPESRPPDRWLAAKWLIWQLPRLGLVALLAAFAVATFVTPIAGLRSPEAQRLMLVAYALWLPGMLLRRLVRYHPREEQGHPTRNW